MVPANAKHRVNLEVYIFGQSECSSLYQLLFSVENDVNKEEKGNSEVKSKVETLLMTLIDSPDVWPSFFP